MGRTQFILKSCMHRTFHVSNCLCLQPGSVFDVIPGDMCSSIILASCAAPSQVHPDVSPLPALSGRQPGLSAAQMYAYAAQERLQQGVHVAEGLLSIMACARR